MVTSEEHLELDFGLLKDATFYEEGASSYEGRSSPIICGRRFPDYLAARWYYSKDAMHGRGKDGRRLPYRLMKISKHIVQVLHKHQYQGRTHLDFTYALEELRDTKIPNLFWAIDPNTGTPRDFKAWSIPGDIELRVTQEYSALPEEGEYCVELRFTGPWIMEIIQELEGEKHG